MRNAPLNCGLARVFFFVSGHGPPLLRYFEQLLLDKGIARVFGALFALVCLGPILVGLAGRHSAPPAYLDWPNVVEGQRAAVRCSRNFLFKRAHNRIFSRVDLDRA
jgi:hypothetical protein